MAALTEVHVSAGGEVSEVAGLVVKIPRPAPIQIVFETVRLKTGLLP
jgi:hypothetical protein